MNAANVRAKSMNNAPALALLPVWESGRVSAELTRVRKRERERERERERRPRSFVYAQKKDLKKRDPYGVKEGGGGRGLRLDRLQDRKNLTWPRRTGKSWFARRKARRSIVR